MLDERRPMTHLEDLAVTIRSSSSLEKLPENVFVYLLVDHSGAPGLVTALRRRPPLRWSSLFADSKEEAALDVAPILISVVHKFADPMEREFLRWMLRACELSTSLTILHSTLDHDVLAKALKKRLDVQLPDRMPVLLRYFDTRILESLLTVLTAAQSKNFSGLASRWQWLDRAGQLQVRESTQAAADGWPNNFEFDVAQQNALIDAGQADALVEQMQLQAPDVCQTTTRAQLHAIAEECAAKFERLSIEDIRSQSLFCLTAVHLGPEFDKQARWVDALARVGKKQVSFEAVVAELGV